MWPTLLFLPLPHLHLWHKNQSQSVRDMQGNETFWSSGRENNKINYAENSAVVSSLSSLTAEWRAGLKWRWRFLEATGYSSTCLSFKELSVPNDYISHDVKGELTTCTRHINSSVALYLAVRKQPAAVINNPKAHENQWMDQSQVLPFLFLSFWCKNALEDNYCRLPSSN